LDRIEENQSGASGRVENSDRSHPARMHLSAKDLFFRESDFQGRMLWLLELSSHFHFGSGGVRFPDMEDFEGNDA
jgi:hypothetical protein